MKRHYTLLICAIVVIGGLYIVSNQAEVSGETNTATFVTQPEIKTLIMMAIPPYKW